MSVLEALGQSPINSAITAGLSKFTSLLRNRVSNAFSDDPGRYPRGYVKTRGILIEKEKIAKQEFDKGYFFQFNPAEIQDVKNTLYEVRSYAGMAYNDYIWSNGGERIISFQLFLDNTPQSKTEQFRPQAINNTALANTIQSEGSNNGNSFQWINNGAYSNTRVSERGILPEVELNSNDLLLDLARIGLGIACVPDYMLKENDQLTPLMLKEPLPGRQLVLAQHDSLTVSQAAERFIEMFTSI